MITPLLRNGTASVDYDHGLEVEQTLARRPFLVATTRAGTPITDVSPDDHLHHLGVSVALPDVDGTTFWGGRTFIAGQGPTLLRNHGTQRTDELAAADGRLVSTLTWLDADGAAVLHERRTITVRVGDAGLETAWVSELTATDTAVSFGSPETNGRDGAFYGGIFWRTPFTNAEVSSADGHGVERAHGSRSPWLAVASPHASILAVNSGGLPWFVRDSGYVGFCPAVAVGERRCLAAGETLRLDLAVLAVDGPLAGLGDLAARAADLLTTLDAPVEVAR